MNGPTFAQPGSVVVAHAPHAARTAAPRPPVAPRAAAAKPADGDPAAALRVLTYLRLHWLLILFCGSLLGAVLAYTAWSLIPTKFESYALLRVASTPTAIGATGDPNRGQTAFATYIKTTAQLMKSEFVLNSALNDPKYKIAELPTLAEQKDAIKYLDEKLMVNYSDGSEVIRLSLEGDRPDDIRKIVDAVKDAYYREVVEKELKAKTDLKQKVEATKTKLEDRIRKKTGGKLDLTGIVPAPRPVPAPGAAPVAPAIPGQPEIVPGIAPVAGNAAVPEPLAAQKARFPVVLNKIFTLEDQIQHYPTVLGEKKAEIDALKKQIDFLRTGPVAPDILAAIEKDPEVLYKEQEAKRATRDYEYIRKVVNNPDSDRVARAKADADKIAGELKGLKEDKLKQVEGGRRQKEADKLFAALDKAERDLRSMQERERVAKKLLDDARKELAELPQDTKKDEEKGPFVDTQKTDLTTLNDIYHRLAAQEELLAYEIESGGRVQKLQDASNPSQKDGKKQVMGTVVAGLMGFAVLALGVVGLESTARKVSSLGELRAAGPTPVVGVVPWTADGSSARDPIRRADVNEAIDKLRSYVAQTWLTRGATTVAVTSPLGDEGKSFAAFGLASSLAQAGYKTLLVDFDLRTPVLHTYAGVANTAGVCELLRGEGDRDLRKAVQSLPSGLQFLPAGKWSDEARQAAVGGRLEALISRLKEPFDCVVLHGHALLTSAESVEIARRSEVVLLCCLYRETRLPLLKRATDRVATMEVPYSGIVYLGATPSEAIC